MADGSRSSRDQTPAAKARLFWPRLLMPSISDTIFIALLVLLTCTSLSVRLLGDAGIGWHIRTGQQILATHAIPHVDSFSSTMNGKAWFAWEWLYDVLVGVLDRFAGLNGVVWFTALVVAGVFACAFRLMLRRGTNVFLALVLLLLAASASMIHLQARPHVVSWLFTLAWFGILDASETDCLRRDSAAAGRRTLWLLPLLMLVWVNVHGGFLIGFVLLGIYWLSAVWCGQGANRDKFNEFLAKMSWKAQARILAAVGFASALASLANPYGWKLHAHIYRYLSNRFLMDHIDEFRSPNFHGVAEKCFALLVLATIVALAARGRELRVSEGLVTLFAVWSGLYAARNLPVSSLLLALVIGPLLSNAIKSFRERNIRWRNLSVGVASFAERMGAVESSLRGHVWVIAALLVTGLVAAQGGSRLGPDQWMNAHFDEKRFPAAAVDFLKNQEAQATVHERPAIMAPDYWGGYLIYRLYPQTLVAMDDRHDLYGEEILKSYLKMMHGEVGWEGLLDQYQIRCVLVPKGSPLANILEKSPLWKSVHADDTASIFERPAVAQMP
jgi:hypothetical protein